jgi:hypothetical protein
MDVHSSDKSRRRYSRRLYETAAVIALSISGISSSLISTWAPWPIGYARQLLATCESTESVCSQTITV